MVSGAIAVMLDSFRYAVHYSENVRDSIRRCDLVGEAPTVSTLDRVTSTGLAYRRAALLLNRVHQLTECLGEFLDAFVLELLGNRVQINPYFA